MMKFETPQEDIDPTERITVEGVEILRYTQGCDGTIFDHATGHDQPTRCVRCGRWTCLCPYCPRCIADDLGLANANLTGKQKPEKEVDYV